MGNEAGNPAKKGASGRNKDAIHFVNARPASDAERLNIKRLVRAHVGKWISTQTKDRAAGSVVVDSSPLIKPDPASQAFELDSDDPYLPSTSASATLSPSSSASSRASPESCISSSSHTGLPVYSAPPQSQPERSLAILPSRAVVSSSTLGIRHQPYDDQYVVQLEGSPESDTPSPPYSGEYIETVGAGSLDPFRAYPPQFEREILQLSEEYCISCLWPGLTPGPSGTNMQSWFPMSLSDSTLSTAFLFGSLSHMRVQVLNGWIPRHLFQARQQRLLEQVELETIKLVSREMNDPSRAVCDAMIFCVVCMAHNKADENVAALNSSPFTAPMQRLQWLDVYGSLRPNLVHIGGLVQMVNLRGGIDKIQLPGLSSIISFSDLVTTTSFLCRPIFPFVPLDFSRRNKTMQELVGYTDTATDHYHSYLEPIGLPRSIAEIFCAMNAYTHLVDRCLEGRMSYDPCLLADQRNIVHYTLVCLPHVTLQPDQTQPHGKNAFYPPSAEDIIYQTTLLACHIYSVGVILPLPAQSTPIIKLADLLYNALQASTHPTAWNPPQAQIMLLWILTIGGIAATHTPHRPWYVDMLSRVAEHNRISSYEDLKRCLGMLAWYPVACEKPGMELWAHVQQALGL
ncbi:hypothetical protein BJX99DRAFT_222937 [Aspergillus californicus]